MPENPKVVEALEAVVAADPESMEMPTTADADKVVAVADMVEQLANAIAERAETAAEEAAIVAEKAERAEEMVAERGGASAAAKQVGLGTGSDSQWRDACDEEGTFAHLVTSREHARMEKQTGGLRCFASGVLLEQDGRRLCS